MVHIKLLFLSIFLSSFSLHAQTEASLLLSCKQADLVACENLSAYYIKKSEWEKAYIIGEMLCSKDIVMGCTFAGTSLLALKKVKEGTDFLTKACDKFEPYACRSMGRLMKSNGEEGLAYIFIKRACYYGLHEICPSLKRPKELYSKAATDLLKRIQTDCSDTVASTCKEHLVLITACTPPLTKQDCLALPGELSIYFRAKLMQSEAKLSLATVQNAEKSYKADPTVGTYSYDLAKVLKNFKPQDRYHYVFGFMDSCEKKYGHAHGLTTSREIFRSSYMHISTRVRANILAFFAKGKAEECYDPKAGFQTFAVAGLDPLNPSRLDVWRSNQDGNLIQMTDGLPVP